MARRVEGMVEGGVEVTETAIAVAFTNLHLYMATGNPNTALRLRVLTRDRIPLNQAILNNLSNSGTPSMVSNSSTLSTHLLNHHTGHFLLKTTTPTTLRRFINHRHPTDLNHNTLTQALLPTARVIQQEHPIKVLQLNSGAVILNKHLLRQDRMVEVGEVVAAVITTTAVDPKGK